MLKQLSLILCITSLLALTGCNKLTTNNYSHLRIGMQRQAVENLFGKPKQCQGNITAMHCTWQEGEATLKVQYLENNVINFEGHNIN